MSQEAVERILGRMLTDRRFSALASKSLETAILQEGFQLTPVELRLLSALDMKSVARLAARLDPRLCRADVTELANE